MCFYLYRDNYVVKIGEGDEQLQRKLQSQGYELFKEPLVTPDDAAHQQQAWQADIDRRRALGQF